MSDQDIERQISKFSSPEMKATMRGLLTDKRSPEDKADERHEDQLFWWLVAAGFGAIWLGIALVDAYFVPSLRSNWLFQAGWFAIGGLVVLYFSPRRR
jgi:hypothetical protein